MITVGKPRLVITNFHNNHNWSCLLALCPPPLKISVATLALAHVAQNLVVVVVGLNLGFRWEHVHAQEN